MPQYTTKRRVPHSAADMFALVADIERYPEFVPLCAALKIKSRMAKENDIEILVAAMTVAYKVVRETFTSRVTLDRPHSTILVEYIDGPFKRLRNRWTFWPAGEASCNVEFFIDYEFHSRVLAMMMGAVFDAAFRRFAVAFEQRADVIYGRKRA